MVKVPNHPHLSQALLSRESTSSPPPQLPTSATGEVVGGSSSLIKSLLASKVREITSVTATEQVSATTTRSHHVYRSYGSFIQLHSTVLNILIIRKTNSLTYFMMSTSSVITS